MNAKKIMGAVLVALLAVTAFAGVAAADETNLGTVFTYQNVSGYLNPGHVWTNGVASVSVGTDGILIPSENFVEGTYKLQNYTIDVKYPTTTISAIAKENDKEYPFIGGIVYTTATNATVTVSSPAGAYVTTLLITYPDGTQVPFWQNTVGDGLFNIVSMYGKVVTTSDAKNGSVTFEFNETELSTILDDQTGTFKLQAVFTQEGSIPPVKDWTTGAVPSETGQLASYIPEDLLLSKDIYTFTVVDPTKATISADVDSVIKDNIVTVTITGVPGKVYNITEDAAWEIVSSGITVINKSWQNFTMPNTGKLVVQMKALETGDQTIEVTDNYGKNPISVKIKVVEGTITAATDAESYYIGNDVTITGTSTAGKTVWFYIAGTNIGFNKLDKDVTTAGYQHSADVKNGEFKFEVEGSAFQKYDAGTYTVYIANNGSANSVNDLDTYTTVALVLKQPFISVTDAPSVAVKGTDYVVKGTAEATDVVAYYIFGTNYFKFDNKSTSVEDGKFTIEIKGGVTDKLDAGQYFMVVQHKMYDDMFNIWANESSGEVFFASTTEAGVLEQAKIIFNAKDRQTANAAQALCDNLDSQNIDDMYVKLSFVVAGPQSVINPIPETIAQGEKLTVSGSTNVGAGKIVTVEMLSTAFAAVPKETVGSASFISLVTKTDENGNWEITFDTTGLNVDEYTVTAAVDQFGSTTAKVNVVEKAPVTPEQPDTPVTPEQPEQPEQPTEPETPGFGALAALAGLGAVAVLLLRRE